MSNEWPKFGGTRMNEAEKAQRTQFDQFNMAASGGPNLSSQLNEIKALLTKIVEILEAKKTIGCKMKTEDIIKHIEENPGEWISDLANVCKITYEIIEPENDFRWKGKICIDVDVHGTYANSIFIKREEFEEWGRKHFIKAFE